MIAALLTRIFAATKATLLLVRDRQEIPLHINESEHDTRAYVTKLKLSSGTRSAAKRIVAIRLRSNSSAYHANA